MNKYKVLLLIGVLSLSVVGCSHNTENISEETPKEVIEEVTNEEADTHEANTHMEEVAEEEGTTTYTHDAGYTDLIHGGFAQIFQELMETIYSRINYSLMGTAVEDITPMDEGVIEQVEEMTKSLNPIHDEEILEIVAEVRQLFDAVNNIIQEKKYELLEPLNAVGQDLYNRYYEWLLKAAENHQHEH